MSGVPRPPTADFTSSLYLGMRHASTELPGWPALTTGRPAVLEPPPGAVATAARLAALTGAEEAVLTRSTLHGLADCLDVLAGPDTGLVVDAGVYPVAQWAVQRAAARRIPVVTVGHHEPAVLAAAVRQLADRGLRPVVVADGVCTGCGRAYPVASSVAEVASLGGILLLDDTQGLGILGVRADHARAPYGRGGGGSVRHAGVGHGAIVTVSSLAKAFGAPVACTAGPADVLARVRVAGSAMHSSPPSVVDVAAAANALDRNAATGDALRALLVDRVRTLRRRVAEHGLPLVGGLFPVQSTPAISVASGRRLLGRLAAAGVRAVLLKACGGSAIALLLTAAHQPAEIERVADVLGAAWHELAGPVRHAR
ncbi:MAG: aminotransferase class I/II-fold pyridoxal phosphate-dependent enzyme [Pseudonocardiales bacterium]